MCNWGWMGGGMWWPHGFGFLGGLLMLAVLIFVIYLFLKMFNSPAGQKCLPARAGYRQHFCAAPIVEQHSSIIAGVAAHY